MILGSAEREILRRSFNSFGAIDLYALHEEFLLSPGQLSRATRQLTSLGLAEVDGLKLKLTTGGLEWIFQNRHDLFLRDRNRHWAEPPEELLRVPVDAAKPYAPRQGAGRKRRYFERLADS